MENDVRRDPLKSRNNIIEYLVSILLLFFEGNDMSNICTLCIVMLLV